MGDPDTMFTAGDQRFDVVCDLDGFELDVRINEVETGLYIALLSLSREAAAPPPRLQITWSAPSHDIAGIWTTDIGARRTIPPDCREIGKHLYASLTRHAPVIALFGSDDCNRMTVAVADALRPIVLDARVREEDALIYYSIELFTEPHEALERYSTEIRFDRRNVSLVAALRDVSEWWAGVPGYGPAPVPDIARQPMYSTWYSYHQAFDPARLLEQVRAAKKLGFGAIIVDDGWQTHDSSRGYAYVGDWQPERLTDIGRFVDAVHAEGMQALLWYAVPFIGEHSKACRRFAGKFLEYIPHYGSYVLDPRYPDARRYLIDHFGHAVAQWHWDGLKLDFIDRFRTCEDTVLEATDGRDYASVYAAVDRLMTDLMGELRAIKPDVAVEFRQAYVGPKMRTYGNMFRAHDCPNLALVNRVRVVDLRLLSGRTAVHSDMIMWHYDEPVEIAAFQLLNVLFSVPQLSVRLDDIPPDHLEMMRFYVAYWHENRDVLLDGEFETRAPLLNYPVVSCADRRKRIVLLYDERVVGLISADKSRQTLDIINAKNSSRIVVDCAREMGIYEAIARDCSGVEQWRRTIDLREGGVAFNVPVSGLLSLTRTPMAGDAQLLRADGFAKEARK